MVDVIVRQRPTPKRRPKMGQFSCRCGTPILAIIGAECECLTCFRRWLLPDGYGQRVKLLSPV